MNQLTEPIWQPQPHETTKAFDAFVVYRDLPPKVRSIDLAYNTSNNKATGKQQKRATGIWNKWSNENHWVARVKAYDAHLDDQRREAFEAERLADAKARITILRGLRGKAVEKLNSISIEDMSIAEMIKIIDLSNIQLRKEYGETDNKQELHIKTELAKLLDVLETELEPEVYKNVLTKISEG